MAEELVGSSVDIADKELQGLDHIVGSQGKAEEEPVDIPGEEGTLAELVDNQDSRAAEAGSLVAVEDKELGQLVEELAAESLERRRSRSALQAAPKPLQLLWPRFPTLLAPFACPPRTVDLLLPALSALLLFLNKIRSFLC